MQTKMERRGWALQGFNLCATVLCLLAGVVHATKSASSFTPSHQTVHMGFMLTVRGAELSTADVVVLALSGPGYVGCGDTNNHLKEASGIEPRNFADVSSDGTAAHVTFIPLSEANDAVWCVKLHPSKTWMQVGSGTFRVVGPTITSATTSFGSTANAYDVLSFTLFGTGLVRSSLYMSFKLSGLTCGGNSSTSDLFGGDSAALASANAAGTMGTIQFQLSVSTSLVSTLRMCMSSNGKPYTDVSALSGLSILARQATTFSPVASIKPSIESTFTIAGTNFPQSGGSTLAVKASSGSCAGDSAASDVSGGDETPATFKSTTSATVSFSLGPIQDSVLDIAISTAGVGYTSGAIAATGGGGDGFSGNFGVGLLGDIDRAYISSHGKDYDTAPEFRPVYPSNVACGGTTSSTCLMTASITQIVRRGGKTRGCGVGQEITGVNGGGGSGFKAVVATADDLGDIQTIRITDHGVGYAKAPQLIMSDAGSCRCGSYIVDGSPTSSSYASVDTAGAFDACFVTVVALGASFTGKGGWNSRDIRLCARFGSNSIWNQISAATIKLLLPQMGSLTPSSVLSGQQFTLQISGSGFELEGLLQTKIKIAYDCDLFTKSDDNGVLPGGWGRSCESISVSGGLQTCSVKFQLVMPGTAVQAQVCRRSGGGLYNKASNSVLSVDGFQILSISPTKATSNAPYIVTVHGVNFDSSLADPSMLEGNLFAYVCPEHVCKGTDKNSNGGEPCAGKAPIDERMCIAGASCETDTACKSMNGTTAGSFPGGSTVRVLRVQNCNSQTYGCKEAVFEWTLMAMANVHAQIFWEFRSKRVVSPDIYFEQNSAPALIPNSRFLLEGSWLTKFEQIPTTTIPSGSPLIVKISGRNLVNTGPGSVKFKFVNTVACSAALPTDDTGTFPGGDGRTMDTFSGTLAQAQGQAEFILSYSFRKTQLSAARLCWKIGPYKYREVEVYDETTLNSDVLGISGFKRVRDSHDALIAGTEVHGMTPSDYNIDVSTNVLLGKLPLPMFESGSKFRVTVIGARFGDSVAESPLVIRPVAMPFAMDDSAISCVGTETTAESRSKSCKEFKYTIDDYDGGARSFCDGKGMETVHVQDYFPISMEKYTKTLDGISTEMSRAVFELEKVLLESRARFMVCWRMGRKDHEEVPWETLGHIDERQRNNGAFGIESWLVWVTHTFGMNGAFLESVTAEPSIVANRPFKLIVAGLGFGCDQINPKFKFKLGLGMGFQAIVGGPIGGGCERGSDSDSEGSVDGGEAVLPTCRPDSISGRKSVFEMDFTVVVQADTKLQLCWSSTAGQTKFTAVFYIGGSTYAVINSSPWYVEKFLIDNKPMTEAKLRAHQPFSLTILGQGLQQYGPVKVMISIAEDCEDNTTIVAGGDWREVDCLFGHQAATVEFNIYESVSGAKICLQRTKTKLIFTTINPPGSRLYCKSYFCGAPKCFPLTNYLVVDSRCDEECCMETCANDPYCTYFQRYEIRDRPNFRRCETLAHCSTPEPLTDATMTPIVMQKTDGLGLQVYAAETLPDVTNPVVHNVTPQVSPALRARSPFVVNVQGDGFVPAHSQVHLKIANVEVGCNDAGALNASLTLWNEVKAERQMTLDQLEFSKNFSYNGTCAGGANNCEGGPAPPGTICIEDADCVPLDGGKCVTPNTGMSCLFDSQCTFKGICNNSLYNLSMTPPPVPRKLQIPFTEVSNAGTLAGGDGRFLNVTNFTFGSTTFAINQASKAVLCYAIRNPEAEKRFLSKDGQITDLRLIEAMSMYTAARVIEVFLPVVSTVTPDHTFLFVDTLYTIQGVGLHVSDKIKVVHPSKGCWKEGLTSLEADAYGAVKGGEGRILGSVNSVGTQGTLRMKIIEPLKKLIDENQFIICYQWGQEKYVKVGDLYVANSPPIVTSFRPDVIYYQEPAHIVLQGMALGAAQKIKLIDALQQTCSGESMNDQVRDEFALAPGSVSSFLTLKDDGDYYEVFQDPYTNHAYLMHSEGLIHVSNTTGEERLYTLCLKYGDLSLSGGTPGYLAVGNITAKQPKLERLVTTTIYSGSLAAFEVEGAGLLTQIHVACKLVEKYHLCSGTSRVAGTVAGGSGCRFLPYPNRSSTRMFADVVIPYGVETDSNVCVRFGNAEWKSIGVLQIRRPLITSAQMFHVSSTSPLQSLVQAEPFYAKVASSVPLHGFDMIKIVKESAECGGTDPLSDAVTGGAGTNISPNGRVNFDKGIDSEGTPVKICVWTYGTSGYEAVGIVRWPVDTQSVTSLSPTRTVVNLMTVFTLTGRGLATASDTTLIYISAGTQCSSLGSERQLLSTDNLNGRTAQFSAEFYAVGEYVACMTSGSSLKTVSALTVTALPNIDSITPIVVYQNKNTAFLLHGSGINPQVQVKIAPMNDPCSNNTWVSGANWSYMAGGGVSVDGTYARTAGFILPNTGTGKLCLSVNDRLSHIIDLNTIITIKKWSAPLLLAPRLVNKTDTQRVEANMSDVVPSCAQNWRSKWILHGPGGGVERDTPAIVDYNTDEKCWKRRSDVPYGYPKEYAPVGTDTRLLSTVRNMNITLTIAGGVGVGDKVFIAPHDCGDNFTHPFKDPVSNYVPGGAPVVVSQDLIVDVTGDMCRGIRRLASFTSPSTGTHESVTGPEQRSYGVKISFSLTEISGVGQFHKLCVVPFGAATAISVENIDIKVRPPMLLAIEPPLVYSGMRMPYILRGLGLSPGDMIKVMNGETFAACERHDNVSDSRGGKTVELDAETTSTTARTEFTLEIPATHARICYKYKGSDVWGEMTNALSLRTSGYVYGYEGAMHFWFGETMIEQGGENMVFGRNQTILVIAPIPKVLIGENFLARSPFKLVIEGDGLTEKARYIVVPIRVRCGGMPAGRQNLMKDKTVYSSVRLRTAIGGESRPPNVFSNDPIDSFSKMSQCTGSGIRDGCFAARATARNEVEYAVGISIRNLGLCRVCYLSDFAAEYREVGQIRVLPPPITAVYPRAAMINRPFSITIRGNSLRSTDRIMIVDGISCHAPISSRPYTVQVSVTDTPRMSTATASLTLVGKGAYTSGKRKICFSYDKGVTFQDSGFTMTVTSPEVRRVFPTTFAIAGERRVWVFGDVITPGDRVKVIHKSLKCQGVDDWESAVIGGEGRALEMMTASGQALPDPIGESQWPQPWPNGSAVFTFMRADDAVVCYLHRDGAGWVDVRDASGKRIVLTVRDTSDLALGRTGALWGNGADRAHTGGKGKVFSTLMLVTAICIGLCCAESIS